MPEATSDYSLTSNVGIILNDFQSVDDENGVKFFDQPEYDVFVRAVSIECGEAR